MNEIQIIRSILGIGGRKAVASEYAPLNYFYWRVIGNILQIYSGVDVYVDLLWAGDYKYDKLLAFFGVIIYVLSYSWQKL